jgi:ketosteroid isomerase-like protein
MTTADDDREPAVEPNDLPRLFVERANAGDVDGLAALYEPDAVLTFPAGHVARGRRAIRAVYQELLADRPMFKPGEQQPSLVSGDLALTSTRLDTGGVTVEVARRQPDGSWLWAIDRFNILE